MERYQEIALEKIASSPFNPRKHFDPEKMKELADSVKAKGIMQPVLVRLIGKTTQRGPAVQDVYELVCGERRFRAAAMVGLKTIPAIIRELDDQSVLEFQIIENLQRTEIHPMEEAEGYFALSRRPGCDVAKIAEKTGRSVKYVYDRLKLLSLTKKAKELFLDNKFTAGHAILLARLSPAQQEKALDPENVAVFQYENVTADLYMIPAEKIRCEDGESIVKPRSVREFQIWIDENVRFEREKVDPMLFPETAVTLQSAKKEEEKIVPITADYSIQTSARADEKTIGPRSWKRADGKNGSKTCEYSVTGVFVVGPGRGEALKVCIAKEKCKVHWGVWQKERQARQERTSPAVDEKQKAREEAAAKQRQDQEAKRESWKKRFTKARPEIFMAFSEAVEKLPANANGVLADLIVRQIKGRSSLGGKVCIGRGKTAEDLIRYLAHLILCESAVEWDALDACPEAGKLVGLDINKIVNEAIPEEKKEPEPKAEVKLTENQKLAKRAAEINREKAAAKKKKN